jgi:hypothetical protein
VGLGRAPHGRRSRCQARDRAGAALEIGFHVLGCHTGTCQKLDLFERPLNFLKIARPKATRGKNFDHRGARLPRAVDLGGSQRSR